MQIANIIIFYAVVAGAAAAGAFLAVLFWRVIHATREVAVAVNAVEVESLKTELEKLQDSVLRNDKDIAAVVVVDHKGMIVEWSPMATAMFHWSAKETIGRGVDLIVPPRLRRRHHEAFDKVLEGKEVRSDDLLTEAMTREGREIRVRVRLSSWVASGQKLYAATISRL